jgi:hypothetical protein
LRWTCYPKKFAFSLVLEENRRLAEHDANVLVNGGLARTVDVARRSRPVRST